MVEMATGHAGTQVEPRQDLVVEHEAHELGDKPGHAHDHQRGKKCTESDRQFAGAYTGVRHEGDEADKIVERGVRQRECQDTGRPAKQHDDQMQGMLDRVAALAHAAKGSRERRGEQTGECLIEHPRERCEDQRVSRCDDGQRGKRTRHASVAEYAGTEDEHKYQQYGLNETSQQHGGYVGQKPRERTTTPFVEQRRAERHQLKHEQQTREPRPHLREDAKLVDEDREDQRPGGRRNRRGEGLRRHDAGEQRQRESDQAIENERPPRCEQGEKDQARQQRTTDREAHGTPRSCRMPARDNARTAQDNEDDRGENE